MYASAFLLLVIFQIEANAQFTATTQQFIVDIHNTLRSKIALGTYVAKGTTKPAATNMLKMKWDTSLATSAQTYAETCPSGHSNIAGVGENLYWRWSSLPFSNMNVYGGAASVAWEQEFQTNGWASNTFTQALFDTEIGHATQMAWANSGLIGCGVKNCGPDALKNNYNRAVVVCHYKTIGNILSQEIYKSGTKCSACPTGTTCETATGLCA
uniref:SCP domain-containing protein n=1 Tax=Caenorhabditis tropicalis TaxID=1561998 RepID=A0A1I7TDQ6_9PELO